MRNVLNDSTGGAGIAPSEASTREIAKPSAGWAPGRSALPRTSGAPSGGYERSGTGRIGGRRDLKEAKLIAGAR